MDIQKVENWLSLKPGCVVKLTDAHSIMKDVDGLMFQVKKIIKLKELNDQLTWLLLNLSPNQWLMVKVVDDDFELRLYHRATDFQPDDRRAFSDRDDGRWLFQEPELDENNQYDINSLVYTSTFDWEGINYTKKIDQDWCAESFETPAPSGQKQPLLATLNEYISDKEHPTLSEALILEIGDADNEDGGLIDLLVGRKLELSDVSVLTK